ncbi:MAG: hypothetical protein ACK4IT_10660 [Thioalkalivibrionaceae bacterium]
MADDLIEFADGFGFWRRSLGELAILLEKLAFVTVAASLSMNGSRLR